MTDIQYPFAYDEKDSLVCIDDVLKENRYEHKYHCPCCGHEMEPRLGDHNAHCFAHVSGRKCGKETYVHHMAKQILEEKFKQGKLEVKML